MVGVGVGLERHILVVGLELVVERRRRAPPSHPPIALIGALPCAPGTGKQSVFLTPAELASPKWLGTEGKPGNVAVNLQSASQFLADQKQIPAAAPLDTFQDALYTRGLPAVITG